MQFHINLKIAALFPTPIDADYDGTIFTTQVLEFEREGMVLAGSNLKPHYLALALAHHKNSTINHVLENYRRAAFFTAMVRPTSRASVHGRFFDQPVVRYRFAPADLPLCKLALRRLANLLFQAGAVEIYLPITGLPALHSLEDCEALIESVSPAQLELQTVHIMSSCAMGTDPRTSIVDLDGRLWGADNIFVSDASILPSNMGESPQGTIMAFSHEIWDRHLEGLAR